MEETNNMRSEAYNEIRYRIMHNKYVPGQKVSEKTISEELGIGRTPVREAIIRIERDGLIDVIPQSGTYISQIDMLAASNARYVRQILEVEIMMEATAKMTEWDYAALEENLSDQARVQRLKDPDAFFDANEEFHKLFYKAAGREAVWDWLQTVNMQLNRFRWIRLEVTDLNWDTLLDQHRQILSAVHERRIDDVRFDITAHLRLMLSEKKYLLERFPDYFINTSSDDIDALKQRR